MSVLLDTSFGNIVIDLYHKECPVAAKNFIKLCKIKYYNNCLFYDVQKDVLAQTGDPTGSGRGGESLYGLLYGGEAKYFDDEIRPHLLHNKKGVVATANEGANKNESKFYITLGDDVERLNEKHTIFGQVVEGLEVLDKINSSFVDNYGRPLINIRIDHTMILDDPFPDPPSLEVPPMSPEFKKDEDDTRPEAGENMNEFDGKTEEQVQEALKAREAHARSEVLTMLGDLPSADSKPPENVLFVCKLNPATVEEDLELIFSRFGTIKSCEVIRDWKTNDSLQYAFIEFSNPEECEQAYFKMDNVLIDDKRIHVDFSQSVSKMPGAFSKSFEKFSRGGAKGNNSKAQMIMKNNSNKGTQGYDMVFDEDDSRSSKKQRTEEPRSSDRHRDKDRDRNRGDKDRSDRDRGNRDRNDRDRDSDRHGSRGGDKRRDDRDRHRDSDRDKGGSRGSDRDRDRHTSERDSSSRQDRDRRGR